MKHQHVEVQLDPKPSKCKVLLDGVEVQRVTSLRVAVQPGMATRVSFDCALIENGQSKLSPVSGYLVTEAELIEFQRLKREAADVGRSEED